MARTVSLFALAGACTATSNPDRSELRPATRTAGSEPAVQGALQSGAAPSAAPSAAPGAAPEPAAPGASAPKTDSPPAVAATATAAPTAAPSAAAPLAAAPLAARGDEKAPTPLPPVLGRVGGEPLHVSEFLRRLWIHDANASREVIEQMVFARMVLFEADRLGVQLDTKLVDSAMSKALAAVEKRLADKGSKLTFDEHVKRNLEVDPAMYRASMRNDAIVSLLAERCVRAWELENGVCRVRITEFRERAQLDAARADLAAGKSFEAVAAQHGAGEDEQAGYTRVPIVRTESQELARLAFATPVGSVGGPLEQSGAWLMLKVDGRDDGGEVRWPGDGERVETSLEREPLQNVEYVQWRAAMTRRYQLDLSPFLDLVSKGRP